MPPMPHKALPPCMGSVIIIVIPRLRPSVWRRDSARRTGLAFAEQNDFANVIQPIQPDQAAPE